MDAIKSFFKKYHAVPATDAGPTWNQASDAALTEWLWADGRLLVSRTLAPREARSVWNRFKAMAKEVIARAARPDASEAIKDTATRAAAILRSEK